MPITRSLEEAVGDSETDRETLALLREKGGGDDAIPKTHAEVAEAHGMSEAALRKRVMRFLAKYQERRQRYLRERERDRKERRVLGLLALGFTAVLAVMAVWGLRRPHSAPLPIEREPSTSIAPPTTPLSPPDNRKNLANPPELPPTASRLRPPPNKPPLGPPTTRGKPWRWA